MGVIKMSYDIELTDNNHPVLVDNHTEGGTYAIGGTTEASLNITWNYSKFFHDHLDAKKGIRWLYGKKAKNTAKRLRKAIKELGTEPDNDYWASTPGNAGHALSVLLQWAKQHPEAIWRGD